MRLCRYRLNKETGVAFYQDTHVVPLARCPRAYQDATHEKLALPAGDDLLPYLPHGAAGAAAKKLAAWVESAAGALPADLRLPVGEVELLTPIPRPNKLFLLAGNYADHIRESGGVAAERRDTFPYVFMKPPSTTLVAPGAPIRVPKVSPDAIDWEVELAVVIGRGGKAILEADALKHVAGYTVINDISDRKFRPNPGRKKREKDVFFDWLHGKWHDGFCPCGPCVTSADAIADPQTLEVKLSLNGVVKQKSSTGAMIFSVAAVIEFISSFVTLEPGDIISTGTPAGVGNATGEYVQPGDVLAAEISQIGALVSPVRAD